MCNRKNFLYLFFPLIFLFASPAHSQSIKNFTPDPVKFIKELDQFFSESNKDDGEAMMKQFTPVWNSGKFSGPQQDAIYKTANAMLRKRMKAFPDFRNYLTTLISFV